jgi:hypothetical protein
MRPGHTLLALIPLLVGCFTYPCETDVLACEEGEAFAVDASCEAEQPLALELIEMQTMQPVQRGAWPIVHHGAQGGIHFDLGIRVRGLEPDHLEVRLDFDAAECRDSDCTAMADVAARTLNADDTVLEPDDDGHLLPNVVLLLDREPAHGGALQLHAMDACGRELEIVHEIEG